MNSPVVSLSSAPRNNSEAVSAISSVIYLSDRRVVFIGKLPAARRTSLASARLIICLSGEMHFQLCENGPSQTCTSLLLPPGLSIAVDTHQALIADCYLEVLGRDHAVLRQGAVEISPGLYRDISCQDQLSTALRQLHQQMLPAADFFRQFDPFVETGLAETDFHADPRIERVVERIKRSPRECLSVDVMAAEVGLSPSRLLALFKAHVGIPIRRYRLWRRLYQSTLRLSAGSSLTEAAMEAGFADSPHFSRTYLDMIGMQPSLLTRNECGLRIFVNPSPARADSRGY